MTAGSKSWSALTPHFILMLLLAAGLTQATVLAKGPDAATPDIVNEQVAGQIRAEAKAEIDKIPAGTDKAGTNAQLRAALERRVALLDEMQSVREAQKQLGQTRSALPTRLRAAEAALKELSTAATAALTPEPSQAAYGALQRSLNEARSDLASSEAAQAEQQRRFETLLPKLIDDARLRGEAALKRRNMLAPTIVGAATKVEQRTLEIQVENAGFDAVVAQQQGKQFDAELAMAPDLQQVLSTERDLAEKRFAQLDGEFARYSEAFGASLARATQQADAALVAAQRAVDEAKTPADRFVADWDLRIVRSEKSRGDVEAQLVNVKKDAAEQQNRMTAETDEATAIKDLISTSGSADYVGERIQVTLQQLRQRQQLLARALETGQVPGLEAHRARRFAVEDSLLGLGEQFGTQRDALAAALAAADRSAFIARTDAQLDTFRTAARDEKGALTELISLAQQIQALTLQRLDSLQDIQGFIRARTFWLRDAKPIQLSVLRQLPGEILAFAKWVATLTSEPVRERLATVIASPLTIVYALLLFPVLPLVLFVARQRVRAITRAINDRVVAEGRQLRLGVLVMLTGVVSAALVPLYFLAGAKLIGAANLPASIGTVAATLFEHLALFLFLWFVSRSFFSRRSIAEVQFGMPTDAANGFHSALSWILIGYIVWLLPSWILARPPFEFVAMPRIFYTLFLAAFAIGVVTLVRTRSLYVRHALSFFADHAIVRHWRTIAGLLTALVVGIVMLDIAGYRYSSRAIFESLAASLAVLIILPPIYRQVIKSVQVVSLRMRPRVSELTGEEGERPEEVAAGAQRSIRFLFFVVGAVLLARFWGFDEQALQTLDEMRVYTVRGVGVDPEIVSVGDLVRCVLIFAATLWILRALSGLFEVAIFPRIQDEGVKYATLTISRYTVFVVGIFMALSAVHLDLGRLGWLMAAIGVGLGFGLQQIVSNFVSGIILLVERPVRPGDTVTIGDMSGKVQRINIRATTILNPDRQEVVVPNSSLITGNVTNWTRGDTVNRLVIPIGVAYGSDVDRVHALLLRIATEQPEVLADPAPSVVFMAHGESSLDFNLRVFVPGPDDIMKLRNRLNTLINKAFTAANIEIPFPQRDLHIRSGDVPLAQAVASEDSK